MWGNVILRPALFNQKILKIERTILLQQRWPRDLKNLRKVSKTGEATGLLLKNLNSCSKNWKELDTLKLESSHGTLLHKPHRNVERGR